MDVFHSLSIKKIFYDKMDLQLFYFRVKKCHTVFFVINPYQASATFTERPFNQFEK